MQSLNNGWKFTENWSEAFLSGRDENAIEVRIPHTVKELPLHYIDHNDYQMIAGYKRKVSIPKEAQGKRVFLQFDGAAHIATVYLNGKKLYTHMGGYTAFRVEISEYVKAGEECEVAVRLDTTENGAIPPFGYVIDYLTYGGIYRSVWLDIQEQEYISDVFVTTPECDRVNVKMTVEGRKDLEKTVLIKKLSGEVLCEYTTANDETTFTVD